MKLILGIIRELYEMRRRIAVILMVYTAWWYLWMEIL